MIRVMNIQKKTKNKNNIVPLYIYIRASKKNLML